MRRTLISFVLFIIISTVACKHDTVPTERRSCPEPASTTPNQQASSKNNTGNEATYSCDTEKDSSSDPTYATPTVTTTTPSATVLGGAVNAPVLEAVFHEAAGMVLNAPRVRLILPPEIPPGTPNESQIVRPISACKWHEHGGQTSAFEGINQNNNVPFGPDDFDPFILLREQTRATLYCNIKSTEFITHGRFRIDLDPGIKIWNKHERVPIKIVDDTQWIYVETPAPTVAVQLLSIDGWGTTEAPVAVLRIEVEALQAIRLDTFVFALEIQGHEHSEWSACSTLGDPERWQLFDGFNTMTGTWEFTGKSGPCVADEHLARIRFFPPQALGLLYEGEVRTFTLKVNLRDLPVQAQDALSASFKDVLTTDGTGRVRWGKHPLHGQRVVF